MNWLRLYHEVLDDPKVQRLDPVAFKTWVNLLCLASRSQARGALPGVEDIAFALRIGEGETRAALDVLIARGLVDAGEGGLAIHNWDARQFRSDNVSDRVRRHRQMAPAETAMESTPAAIPATPNETLPETLPATTPERSTKRKRNAPDTDTETETETEAEQRRAETGAAAQPANVTPIARGKRATKAPECIELDATQYGLAESLGFTRQEAVDETARFLDWHRAKGNTFVDWGSAWRNWMRKAQEIRDERRAGDRRSSGRLSPDAYAAEFDRLMNRDARVVEAAT